MSEIICQTVNLSKKYKGKVALEKVNINIKKGEIYGLIGENGAGKTTLIKTIAQLIKPTEGNVKLFGQTKMNYVDCKKRWDIQLKIQRYIWI